MLESVSKASATSLPTEGRAGQVMLLWVSPKYYTILKLQLSYIAHLLPSFLLILLISPLSLKRKKNFFFLRKICQFTNPSFLSASE